MNKHTNILLHTLTYIEHSKSYTYSSHLSIQIFCVLQVCLKGTNTLAKNVYSIHTHTKTLPYISAVYIDTNCVCDFRSKSVWHKIYNVCHTKPTARLKVS